MSLTQRYFIEISFNGTAYHGWQIQKNAISVQQVLNQKLSILCRKAVETVGCGRTDTGVHATQFYAHFDSDADLDLTDPRIRLSLNSLLPYDMCVKSLIKVSADAHARFDAVKRTYEYFIHFHKDPFRHNLSWLLRDPPEMQLMNQAADILREYSDFSSFSKSNTQTFTNNCIIKQAFWTEIEDGLKFTISADRFLRNMVRAIVGTLVNIGKRELEPEQIRNIIESKNRSNAGESVPACGLFLSRVEYPYFNTLESSSASGSTLEGKS